MSERNRPVTDSTTANRRLPTTGVDAPVLERLDAVRTDDDVLIVYDVDCQDAWLQSDHSRSLEAKR